MFERNKVDTVTHQQATVAAEMELDDGVVLKGKFIISAARAFFEVLNSPSQFLEFEPYGEDRLIVAKSSIRALKLVSVPNAPNLQTRVREVDVFDPYLILGIAKSAAWDEVREAYVRLAKIYHPDRYESVDLPPEVREYLQAMSRRINAAHAALEQTKETEKSRVSTRVEPIYTSQPR